MRNRAKCAECKDIIESLAFGDVVTCSCGNCTIWGGEQALHSNSKDYSKFLRIGDDGVEKSVIFVDNILDEGANLPPIVSTPLDELRAFKEYLDKWPAGRLHSPCTYADLRDLSSLVLAALQSPPL